jgi:hypothetical protein
MTPAEMILLAAVVNLIAAFVERQPRKTNRRRR